MTSPSSSELYRKKMNRYLSIGLAALPLCACSGEKAQTPNIIYILADDLGYGDISSYGQEHFQTPCIDSLASQGMLFTRHYAGCSVSAPSRSSLITGQHTGHTFIRGNKELPGEGQYPLPADTWTVFDLVKEHGYTTGVFGKWGLGGPGTEGAPENQGVDEFFGYNCQRMAHNYYPGHLWHNGEKVILEGNKGTGEDDYAPDIIHAKALEFIREHSDGPFLMMYTSILPHAELRLPQEEIDAFAGKLDPETPFSGCDSGPVYKKGGYGSQQHPHAAFAAMVTHLDRQVGEIVRAVRDAGISDNTIIIFTSDNGPHMEGGADPAYFNSSAGLRGIKRDLYEGGIRVPLIVCWPGVVSPGSRTDHVSAFWDFLPTVADILDDDMSGRQSDYSSDSVSDVSEGELSAGTPLTDGISFLPVLTGEGTQSDHGWLYWEFHEDGGRKAVLKDNWKGIVNNVDGGGKMELYDLSSDPGETMDLSDKYPGKVTEMYCIMQEARTPSPLFD